MIFVFRGFYLIYNNFAKCLYNLEYITYSIKLQQNINRLNALILLNLTKRPKIAQRYHFFSDKTRIKFEKQSGFVITLIIQNIIHHKKKI